MEVQEVSKESCLSKSGKSFERRVQQMNDGFVKVAAVTPHIKVANVEFNKKEICKGIKEASDHGAKIIVFPELCVTGYSCGDLFAQELLIEQARLALTEITKFTSNMDALIFIGLPFSRDGKLYNVVAILNRGNVLGLATKTYLPNYRDMDEMRYFSSGPQNPEQVEVVQHMEWNAKPIPFGANLLVHSTQMSEFIVSVEVCEDLWAPIPTGVYAAIEGAATVIVNCSASNDTIGKYQKRQELMKVHSSRLICGYVYANAGEGESTTNAVFGGHNLIVENGQVLAESNEFENGIIYSDLDIKRLAGERQKNTTFRLAKKNPLWKIPFDVSLGNDKLDRKFSKTPFVPKEPKALERGCKEALQIQALGLKKRLEHTGAKTAVIGVSGGLDSTLALLVANKAFELLGKDQKEIIAVIMPGFGTSRRTYENGMALCKSLGVTVEEISIEKAVLQHFDDIGHDSNVLDTTYENAQARERTQILMDLANQRNGLVIGTGSMSELALGWATYNGDHMSMYGVNGGVPKTLVKHLIQYEIDRIGKEVHKETGKRVAIDELNEAVKSILETPISPELLPSQDESISQKTEDVIGPYKLHDFFLYYMLKYNYSPSKIYRIAVTTFEDEVDPKTILKWLKVFYTRFFSQQFKRSCMPDGPAVCGVSLSPRSAFKMPSDACADLWLKDLEDLQL